MRSSRAGGRMGSGPRLSRQVVSQGRSTTDEADKSRGPVCFRAKRPLSLPDAQRTSGSSAVFVHLFFGQGSRLVFQHDRDIVTDRIGKARRERDQLLTFFVEDQRPFGDRTYQNIKEFLVHNSFPPKIDAVERYKVPACFLAAAAASKVPLLALRILPHLSPPSLWANHPGMQVPLFSAELTFCRPRDSVYFWLLVQIVLVYCLSAVANGGKGDASTVLPVSKVAENVYALLDPTTNRDREKLGKTANLDVIVTEDGVVLIDPGASYKGARPIHDAVRSISDLPVKAVTNTRGQDPRWLGNSDSRRWVPA